MAYFRDYNLIELIEETSSQAKKGTAREYLEWFSPGVRAEIMLNFNAVSDALESRRKNSDSQDF